MKKDVGAVTEVLAPKKSLKSITNKPVQVLARFEGKLKSTPHPTNPDLLLVAVADAPNVPEHFPKMSKLIPPTTYYVFDPSTKRVVHMLSECGSAHVGWDSDRDGRYFRHARRPVIAPRFVEYCFDAGVAHAAGEDWGPLHPNYRGTLGSRKDAPGRYDDHNSPRTRRDAAAGDTAPKRTLQRSLPAPDRGPAPAPTKPEAKRLLRKAGVTPDDTGILSAKGLDQDRLNSAAEDIASKLAGSFAPKSLRKMKRS